ncbi:MAG TPA: hypothetical protein VF077_09730 [Nitrospiraceae bacterium]
MVDSQLPGTEGMKCAIGLYEGTREYVEGPFKGHKVSGVFSYVDIVDEPCNEPVRFWCKRKGTRHAWLACANPEHQRDAESVVELTPERIAFLVWQQKPGQPLPECLKGRKMHDPFIDAPKRVIESTPPPKALPPKKRIPRNKKPKKPSHEELPIERAMRAAGQVFNTVKKLVDKG